MANLSSVLQYFETLRERFKPDAAKGVDAVFQWSITGDGGKDFYATVKDGDLSIAEGRHEKPTVTLSASAENYLKIVNKQMNGTMAVMTRKMKVDGNIATARKMQSIFPLD